MIRTWLPADLLSYQLLKVNPRNAPNPADTDGRQFPRREQSEHLRSAETQQLSHLRRLKKQRLVVFAFEAHRGNPIGAGSPVPSAPPNGFGM